MPTDAEMAKIIDADIKGTINHVLGKDNAQIVSVVRNKTRLGVEKSGPYKFALLGLFEESKPAPFAERCYTCALCV